MRKSQKLFIVLIIFSILSPLYVWTVNAQAKQSKSIIPGEKAQISEAVKAYFDARYHSFSNLEMDSF